MAGTKPYLSPERKLLMEEESNILSQKLNSKNYLERSDVFSLGLTLLEAISLRSI